MEAGKGPYFFLSGGWEESFTSRLQSQKREWEDWGFRLDSINFEWKYSLHLFSEESDADRR